VCDCTEEICSTYFVAAYTAAVFRVNMLKDNIEMDTEEIKLMIVRSEKIDKYMISIHFYYPRSLLQTMNTLPS
jgi:hypothetical protein